jgi:hypothetical protein
MSARPILIIAEKPSVARDLAKEVKATTRGNGYFHGNGYSVTWAIGHLVTLPEPAAINPQWKTWNFKHLPILPQHWPLSVVEKTRAQFEIVQQLLEKCDAVLDAKVSLSFAIFTKLPAVTNPCDVCGYRRSLQRPFKLDFKRWRQVDNTIL